METVSHISSHISPVADPFVDEGDNVQPRDPTFIMVWRTTGASETITLPATGVNDFEIDWGDGVVETITTPSPSHQYALAGDHEVRIVGSCAKWYQNNVGDKEKLIEIKQWGNVGFTELDGAFYGCLNMVVTATDQLDVSAVTTLYRIFQDCSSLTALDVSGWDVSAVTTLASAFFGCSSLTALDMSAGTCRR